MSAMELIKDSFGHHREPHHVPNAKNEEHEEYPRQWACTGGNWLNRPTKAAFIAHCPLYITFFAKNHRLIIPVSSIMSTKNAKSSTTVPPSLKEFEAFHGMVCNPISSQRCIQYFDGCALFASQEDYATTNLKTFDYTRTPIPLNIFTYYMLVVFSCTGLISLLGMTTPSLICEENTVFSTDRFDKEKEDLPVVQSKTLKNIPGEKILFIPNKVIFYIIQRSLGLHESDEISSLKSALLPKVKLIRRFEYQFGNLLSVMMCHFVCNDHKYLVEVYSFHHTESFVARIISSIMKGARWVLDFVGQPKKKQKEA